jgi:DNA-binding NarL/FixJ family response regulator
MLTQPSIRVLIVDDMANVRQDLRTVLSMAQNTAGFSMDGTLEIVGEAGNGQEAVRQAQALRPDVILMDLGMPVLDGCAATRQIKACDPAVGVIALTVHGDDETREKARRAGVDHFIVKGDPLDEILQAIDACAKRRRASMQKSENHIE